MYASALLLFVCLASARTLGLSSPHAEIVSRAANEYLFVLGDSYSAFGFEITGEKPSTTNPIGNPPFPGWGSCGPGANWVANYVSKYKSAQSTLSYNLAFGGATVNATLVPPYKPEVRSIIDQTKIFSDNLANKPEFAPWNSENTVFALWQGINDVSGSWWQPDPVTLVNMIFDDYFEQIELLYAGGARKFVFLTVPPIERSPMVVEGGSQENVKSAVESWNSQLAARVTAFGSVHPDIKTKVYDTANVFNTLLDQGGEEANCFNSDGVTCLWSDNFHPGLKIHDVLSQDISAIINDF